MTRVDITEKIYFISDSGHRAYQYDDGIMLNYKMWCHSNVDPMGWYVYYELDGGISFCFTNSSDAILFKLTHDI